MLKSIVESRFAVFVPMLADVAARGPSASTVQGALFFNIPKLYIRPQILRALEATLIILAVAALAIILFGRPLTLLREHPGTLQYVVWLLANSPVANDVLEGLGSCDERQINKLLENTSCRLSTTDDDDVQFEISCPIVAEFLLTEPAAGKSDAPESYLMMSSSQMSLSQQETTDMTLDTDTRYRPAALRLGSRALISLALVAVAMMAGISLYISDSHGGYLASMKSTSAWDLVPSIILVIIGYVIQSTQHAALSLATYTQLAANTFRSRLAMIRRQIQDASKAIVTNRMYEWSIISLPCVVLLLTIPALQIMAGKLFVQTYGSTTVLSSFPANVSQLERFNNLSLYIPFGTAGAWANSWQQTLFAQNAIARPIDIFVDKVGPLYLSIIDYNITTLLNGPPETAQADLLESRLMAVNTSVTCSAVNPAGIGLFLQDCNRDTTYYTFKFDCITAECKSQLGQAFSEFNITINVFPNVTGQGISTIPYYSATFPSLTNDSSSVLIAVFSPLGQAGLDYSQLNCDNKPLSPTLLGKFMPGIRAVNCTRQLNLVHANVTFARWDCLYAPMKNQTGKTNGQSLIVWRGYKAFMLYSTRQQWAWQPQSYDARSIELISPVIAPGEGPAPIIVPDGGNPFYHLGRTPAPLLSPYTFTGLLQQVQELGTGNQLDLLDVNNLISTTQNVYESFTMGALQDTIGYMYSGSLSSSIPVIPPIMRNYTAKFTLYKPAMRQETGFTATLIGLVLISFFAIGLLSLSIPRSTLLPKAPNSIAAQMSILAGSNLVSVLQEVRKNGRSVDVFEREMFGLGWWPIRDGADMIPTDAGADSTTGLAEGRHNYSSSYRWGVDIGHLPEDYRKLRSRTKTQTRTSSFNPSYDAPPARHLFFHRNSSSPMTAMPKKVKTAWTIGKKEARVTTTSYESVPSLNTDEIDSMSRAGNIYRL